MSWVAVAIGGAALVSGAASYAGAKKQGDASKDAANLQMQQWERINQQQQPYIQSGYGAIGRLNTLLGLGGPRSQMGMPQVPQGNSQGFDYMPTPSGGITKRLAPYQPQGQKNVMGVPANAPNFNLNRILALRAAHGDTEAQRMLDYMQ